MCEYQEPATYTIGIFDERGDEILQTEARPANTSVVMDLIEARLESGSFYSAELTISHQHVPGEAFVTFIGIGKIAHTLSTSLCLFRTAM